MIRLMKPTDINDVMHIWLAGNRKAHYFINESYWDEQYNRVFEMMSYATIYVEENEQQIKGFIGIFDNEIAGLFVREDAQHKGIGTALLTFVKKLHEKLSLYVYVKNDTAYLFYLKEGFYIHCEHVDKQVHEIEYQMIWKGRHKAI